MATLVLTNTQTRLFTGPLIPGHSKAPSWKPGKNDVDAQYWASAKRNSTVHRWLQMRWIKVVEDTEEHSMEDDAPTHEDLMSLRVAELEATLADPSTPRSWHESLRRAIEEKSAVAAPMDPHAAKSLVGIQMDKALTYVAECTDLGMLAFWRGEETDAENERSLVIDAIDQRLAELSSS